MGTGALFGFAEKGEMGKMGEECKETVREGKTIFPPPCSRLCLVLY